MYIKILPKSLCGNIFIFSYFQYGHLTHVTIYISLQTMLVIHLCIINFEAHFKSPFVHVHCAVDKKKKKNHFDILRTISRIVAFKQFLSDKNNNVWTLIFNNVRLGNDFFYLQSALFIFLNKFRSNIEILGQ